MNKLRKIIDISVDFVLGRKKTFIALGLVCVLALYFGLVRDTTVFPKTSEIKVGNIEQSVSVTGKVEAAENVDLSFDKSGKVSTIYLKVGDAVRAGQVVAMIDSSELFAQKSSYQASLKSAQAKYDQVIQGASAEDLRVLQTNLDTTKRALSEARNNSVKETIKSAINISINSLVSLSEIQKNYTSTDFSSYALLDKKAKAMMAIYGIQNSGVNLSTAEPFYFTALKPQLISKLDEIEITKEESLIDGYLNEAKEDLNLVRITLDEAFYGINLISAIDADKTKLATAKTNILTQLSTVSTQQQSLTSYVNAVSTAQAQLDQKKAPASDFDVEIAKATLDQAKANLELINAQINKNMLTSPISGTVANLDLKVGEIATPGKTVALIIGSSGFQVAVNIPEADVAKIGIGDEASITLDAYGQDIVWKAKIAKIYPAEKIIEGVSTYKTIMQFDSPDDRIRSGMTANVDITKEAKKDVLLVPQRAVITKSGGRAVKLYVEERYADDQRYSAYEVSSTNDKFTIFNVDIKAGIRGSNGEVELLSGLQLGDRVVIE